MKRITIFLLALFSIMAAYGTAPAIRPLAITDTLKVGPEAISLRLPETSIIAINDNLVGDGLWIAAVIVDSLNLSKSAITIFKSTTGTEYYRQTSKYTGKLLKSRRLGNSMVINIYKEGKTYLIEAFSDHRQISFTFEADNYDLIKQVEKILQTVTFLDLENFDNSKSYRKKKPCRVRF